MRARYKNKEKAAIRGMLVFASLLVFTAAYAVEDRFPRVADAYLVKRDGRVLWAAAPNERRAPASLTKMMTALLVLERGQLEEPVVVSRAASRERGSHIGLRAGEQLRARDLLAATIMHSANDACRALADHGGPTFVARMNQRARALGLRDTNFVDPCGHDRPGQYSSAADLARLAEQVLQHPDYRELAAIRTTTIRTLDGRRRYYLRNTNALIGHYPGVIGVKTGTTGLAGYCLIAAAEKNGSRVIVVLLNSPRRWSVTPRLLDTAFATPL
jgi:serine-type D-Ala-D-Ala carboxypeptidase (penicillin-binding protein 5/6)